MAPGPKPSRCHCQPSLHTRTHSKPATLGGDKRNLPLEVFTFRSTHVSDRQGSTVQGRLHGFHSVHSPALGSAGRSRTQPLLGTDTACIRPRSTSVLAAEQHLKCKKPITQSLEPRRHRTKHAEASCGASFRKNESALFKQDNRSKRLIMIRDIQERAPNRKDDGMTRGTKEKALETDLAYPHQAVLAPDLCMA